MRWFSMGKCTLRMSGAPSSRGNVNYAAGMPECAVNEVSRPVGKGVKVPLSEEEQRILQEMEQKLYEHDREFVDRVNHGSHRLRAAKGAKWSVAGFVAGFAVLLSTFRFSLALGALG